MRSVVMEPGDRVGVFIWGISRWEFGTFFEQVWGDNPRLCRVNIDGRGYASAHYASRVYPEEEARAYDALLRLGSPLGDPEHEDYPHA